MSYIRSTMMVTSELLARTPGSRMGNTTDEQPHLPANKKYGPKSNCRGRKKVTKRGRTSGKECAPTERSEEIGQDDQNRQTKQVPIGLADR